MNEDLIEFYKLILESNWKVSRCSAMPYGSYYIEIKPPEREAAYPNQTFWIILSPYTSDDI